MSEVKNYNIYSSMSDTEYKMPNVEQKSQDGYQKSHTV
jgi:hypothetical protein